MGGAAQVQCQEREWHVGGHHGGVLGAGQSGRDEEDAGESGAADEDTPHDAEAWQVA